MQVQVNAMAKAKKLKNYYIQAILYDYGSLLLHSVDVKFMINDNDLVVS